MSSSTCQQFVDDAVKISNIFLDFQLSQGSVATYCRCGGNLSGVYIHNFRDRPKVGFPLTAVTVSGTASQFQP